MSSEQTPPGRVAADPAAGRVAALDGLRGVTILLVMLGHAGSLLWPMDRIDQTPFLRGFFSGGAVGTFFVISGYLVGRSLLRQASEGTLDPLRFTARRWVRVGVQTVPLAVALVTLKLLDTTDTASLSATVDSAANLVLNTTNQQAAVDVLSTRADLGHMWYVAVLQQIYLALPLVILLLGSRRWALTALLVEVAVFSVGWRYHLLATQGWVFATISTVARADAVVLGVLVAVHLGVLRKRLARWAPAVLTFGVLTAVVLLAVQDEAGTPYNYLTLWGIAFLLAGALSVVGVLAHDHTSRVLRLVSARPLVALGRASLVLFVWHLPIFYFVARHTSSWTWLPRAIFAVSLLAGITWAATVWIEEPVRRWLKNHLQPTTTVTRTAEAIP